MVRLILASRSPRRRELLTEAGYEFEVLPPSEEAEDETLRPGESAAQLAVRLAQQKAADVVRRIACRFQIPPVCPAPEQRPVPEPNPKTTGQNLAFPGSPSVCPILSGQPSVHPVLSEQPPARAILSELRSAAPEQSPACPMRSDHPPKRPILSEQFPVPLPSGQAPPGLWTNDPVRFEPVSYDPAGQKRPTGPIQAIVIGCDTVVECQGHILGKPTDQRHARQILESLSGQEHWVYSGLCLWPLPTGQPQCQVAASRLRMDPLRPDQLEEYLQSGQWEGKAGAFGYQDRLGWVHLLEGSPSNVVGLPLELLAQMLSQLLKPAANS